MWEIFTALLMALMLPFVMTIPVFLAMVSSGQAVLDMKSGAVTASNLETLPRKALADFEDQEF